MSAGAPHWQMRVDERGIAWLVLDRVDSAVNTLSQDVLHKLDERLTELESARLRGLVVKSGKSTGFILGADVKEFRGVTSAAHGMELASRGQSLLARISALGIPTVAAIDGYALGGGLELALACDYRVVTEGDERTLGLPEVQLGIHPGFGGSVRAVELLGAPLALDLMCTGRLLAPLEAAKIGLVDRVVSSTALDSAAAEIIAARPRRRRASWLLRALNLAVVRPFVAWAIAARARKRVRPAHYPAPFAIIALWRRYGGHGAAAYRAEAESLGKLLVTDACRNLVRVFGLRERLRSLAPREATVGRVHVIGAGTMGGDIAAWCALRGLTVTLQDRTLELVAPALKRAQQLFSKRLRKPGAATAAAKRLTVDIEAREIGSAEVVIEAIVEQLDAKLALFRELEPKVTDATLIATNTSSIQLEELSPALQRPGRFVGLHFFNPVASLPLVEVITGRDTDSVSLRRALSFVVQIGKLPLPCRSAPGFVVNRILTPYMLEALRAHEDGHALETIDAAARAFGMPSGPIELADRIGLDVALHVAQVLSPVLGGSPPALLATKVAARELGVKTGQGFYAYNAEGLLRKRRRFAKPTEDLVDRLMLPLLNEAVACYAEGVVDDVDLLDAGVLFGTGFAPFTGGPIQYARARGIDAIVARLREFADRFGTRFTPHRGWETLRTGV